MLRRLRPRLTYANVAATLALVFAMGGSAVAASHYLITSSKQISPKVIKELKTAGKPGASGAAGAAGGQGPQGPQGSPGTNGTNGANGKEGKDGARGPAGLPGLEGATGPEGPEGGTSAALKRWRKTIAVAGASKASPATTTLLTIAPFKIVGHCYKQGEETVAETYIATSEAESFAAEPEEGEEIPLFKGEEASITPEPAEGEEEEGVFKGPNGGLFSAQSKSGSVAIDGASNEGVFLSGEGGPACFFSGYAVAEE